MSSAAAPAIALLVIATSAAMAHAQTQTEEERIAATAGTQIVTAAHRYADAPRLVKYDVTKLGDGTEKWVIHMRFRGRFTSATYNAQIEVDFDRPRRLITDVRYSDDFPFGFYDAAAIRSLVWYCNGYR